MNYIKKQFENWTKIDYAWLLIANAVIMGLSLYWGDGLIPIISALTGVTCVIFVSKRMTLNYCVGAVNVALYAFLALQSRLYGDFMLNILYYFPMQFIGIILWTRAENNSEDGNIEAKSLSNKQRVKLGITSIVLILAYSLVLKILGGNIPLLDATSTVLSVIAMILMIKQYLEQWHLWVIINAVSVLMWYVSLRQGNGDYSTLLMWIVYLVNSIFGLYNWNKANKNKWV